VIKVFFFVFTVFFGFTFFPKRCTPTLVVLRPTPHDIRVIGSDECDAGAWVTVFVDPSDHIVSIASHMFDVHSTRALTVPYSLACFRRNQTTAYGLYRIPCCWPCPYYRRCHFGSPMDMDVGKDISEPMEVDED
jgi:hypothetical protein